MNAATVGEFVGLFLAAGGVAYIWLGVLWGARAYKRWPRVSYWSAALIPLLLGVVTAAANGQYLLTMSACMAASAFVFWRGRSSTLKGNVAERVPKV